MLPFTVEIHASAPVYEQVVYAVKKAILIGQLRPDDPFPSVRSLSQELRINPNTAHKVVAALIDEGLLVVRPGLGTTVAATTRTGSPEDRTLLLEEGLERLVVEARQLGLEEEQVIAALRRHWKKYHPL